MNWLLHITDSTDITPNFTPLQTGDVRLQWVRGGREEQHCTLHVFNVWYCFVLLPILKKIYLLK